MSLLDHELFVEERKMANKCRRLTADNTRGSSRTQTCGTLGKGTASQAGDGCVKDRDAHL